MNTLKNILSIVSSKLLFIVIILVIASVSKSYAITTYYVRTDGNNSCSGTTDASGSSGSCAFRNIQNGVNAAQAGDIVIVHSGDYSATVPTFTSVRSGSSGNLITVKAALGETVSVSRIRIAHGYNVVQGFRVLGMGANTIDYAGVGISADYVQVLDSTFIGNCQPWVGGEGSCIAILSTGNYNTFSYNIFDGVNNGTNTSIGIAINLGGSTSNSIISYNIFQDINTPGRLMVPQGTGHTISHNEVKNCMATYVNAQVHPDVFQVFYDVSRNIIIEDNYIHEFAGQLGNIEGNSNPGNGLTDNWIFRNNIIANVGAEIFIREYVTNMQFYNNTFYHCAGGATGYPIYAAYTGVTGMVKNNAFIACGVSTWTGFYLGNLTGDYNFVSNTGSGGSKTEFSESHGVNGGNPQLKSVYSDCTANTCDFHVGATSALINVGTTIAGFSADNAGVSRPQGAAWDIGAYEYIKKPNPPTSLSFISN